MSTYLTAWNPTALLRTTRKVFVFLHRWLSLLAGLLVLVVTTSGALLVFNNALYDWENPYLRQPMPTAAITLDEAAQAVLAAYPGSTITWLGTPRYAPNHGAYEIDVQLADDSQPWIYVDPSQPRILGAYDYEHSLLNWLFTLHESLWLDQFFPDQAPGAIVVGVLGIALLLMSLTGLVVWWPSLRGWLLAFTVRWQGRGWYIRNYDLHKVIGILSLPLLFVVTVTGISYAFYDPFTAAWNTLLPGALEQPEDLQSQPNGQPALSYTALAQRAQAIFPQAEVVYLTPADGDTGVVTVYLSAAFNPAAADGSSNLSVVLDRYTGAVLFQQDLRAATPGQQIYDEWFWPLHVGTLAGWPTQVLWFLVGLAPLALAVTGLTTWLMRWAAKWRRARRRQTASARMAGAEPMLVD